MNQKTHSTANLRIRGSQYVILTLTSLILCFIFSTSRTHAQASEPGSYRVDHFGSNNGFMPSNIFGLHKDSHGIIWASSRTGLSRYNGFSFETWDFKGRELWSGYSHILEDNNGYLWLVGGNEPALGSNILLFSLSTREFVSINDLEGYPNLEGSIVVNQSTEDKTIFIYTEQHSLIKFRNKGDFESITFEGEHKSFPNLWIDKGGNSVLHFSDKHFSGKSVPSVTAKYNNKGHFVRERIESDLKIEFNSYPMKYWYGPKKLKTNSSIDLFLDQMRGKTNTPFSRPALGKPIYFDITQRLFWYEDNSHLIGFHPEQGTKFKIEIDGLRPNVLISDIIFSNDDIWIATMRDGLYRIRQSYNKFYAITAKNLIQNRRIIKDVSGNLWISSNGQIVTIDKNLNIKSRAESKGTTPLFKDSKSNIWSVNRDFDLINYDENLQISSQTSLPFAEAERTSDCWAITEGPYGYIWYSVPGGLAYLDTFGNVNRPDIINDFHSFLEARVYEILIKDDDHFWLCTSKGLYLFHRKKGLIARYWDEGKGSFFLPALDFHHLHVDEDNVYWLATGDGGLIKWIPQLKSNNAIPYDTEQFSKFEGMPSNIIHGIYEDDNGYLWLSSEGGIIQFHKEGNNFRIFTEEDGVDNNEFNRISHFQDNEGTIFFGSIEGITFFDPDDFIIDSIPSPFGILSLGVFTDNAIANYFPQYQQTSTIQFDDKNDYFILEFGSVDQIEEEIYSYYYAYDQKEKWIPLVNNNLTISNLSYGDHQLFIKKENLPGKRVGQIQIRINVPSPFFLQTWFWLCCFAILCMVVYLVVRWKTKTYKNRQKELESLVSQRTAKIQNAKSVIQEQAHLLKEINESKSRFFSNIAHELRNPLTLITGSNKIIEQNTLLGKESKEILKYTKYIEANSKKILRLTDEVLTLSKLETIPDRLNESPISPYLLINNILAPFENQSIVECKTLLINIHIDKEVVVNLDVPKFEKVVNNLITNAFKYSPEKSIITTNFNLDIENKLHIEVIDKGYGISKEDLALIFKPYFRSTTHKNNNTLSEIEGIGLGLTMVEKLVSILGGVISVTSQVNKGSTFSFTVPVTPVDYSKTYPISKSDFSDNDDLEPNIIQPMNDNIHSHILIVEDNFEIRQFVRELLESFLKISVASNGKAALELLNANFNNKSERTISLIISDVMMPEMDGVNFLKRVKGHEQWKHIPFLFLTGYTNQNIQTEVLALGVEDYLIKPFEPQELLSRVQYLLKNKKSIEGFTENNIDQADLSNSYDAKWNSSLKSLVFSKIEDSNLNVDILADELSISKRQLTRKVKSATGLTPGKYILEIRLQHARKLLESGSYHSVTAISYSVGFKTPKYFSKQFKSRFGRLPSTYFS